MFSPTVFHGALPEFCQESAEVKEWCFGVPKATRTLGNSLEGLARLGTVVLMAKVDYSNTAGTQSRSVRKEKEAGAGGVRVRGTCALSLR